MNQISIAICDADSAYGNKLAEYLLETGNVAKAEVYTDWNSVEADLNEEKRDIWLINSGLLKEAETLPLKKEMVCVSYRIENPLQLLGLFSYDMDQRAKVHKWIGYTGSGNEDGTYVYITETGKSYHRFSDCTYLDLSILAVPEETVSGLRNDSGAKYKDCEKCRIGKKDTKTVFVTEYGEAVHNSLSCSGLKRTVYRILLEEAGNHSPCGKCEKRKAS